MDLTTIVLSIIYPGFLAYWGIWYTLKYRQKAELSLVDRYWIPLINTYERPFQSLELLNYQLPFNANHYYYRGILINTGNIDIHKNIVIQPFKISFSDEIKILNFRLLTPASDFDISYTQSENEIIVRWDILKPFEKISFELIIESTRNKPVYELGNLVMVNHRIAELNIINRLNYRSLENSRYRFVNYIPTYIISLLLFGFGFWGLFKGIYSFSHKSGFVSYSIISDFTKEPVDLEYYNVDSIIVKSEKHDELIAINTINSKIQISPEIKTTSNSYLSIIFGVLMIGLTSILFVSIIKQNRQEFLSGQIFKSLE